MTNRETVLILDFGSQYTQLIARRCREEGVYSWIESFDFPLDKILDMQPVGIILSGGPNSVYDDSSPQRVDDLMDLPIPKLGICYGMQLLVKRSGGEVVGSDQREYGRAEIRVAGDSRLLKGLNSVEPVWMSHGDQVGRLTSEWNQAAVSNSGIIAGVENDRRLVYGVQFHPEVSHTPSGGRVLRNFLYDICGAEGGWNMAAFAEDAVRDVKARVGDRKVICALSGGVDSSVAATLVHQAVGDKLTCIFVDNGVMRKDEAQEVEAVFRPRFGDALRIVDASEEFLADLKGVTDPEQKRIRIGHKFIDVFQREALTIQDCDYLVQGTLYPDVIESSVSKGPAHVIKSHHNVGGLPEKLDLKLIEPLRDLFKDEVRQVGRELGLPETMIMRHPFPGPGLAIRILGEVDGESVATLQKADAIFLEELRNSGYYEKTAQAFAVLLPVKSVGVMGDFRTYDKVLALRSVDTPDFMTADFSQLPMELLGKVASRIANEVRGINRVVYDITSKPPATVEWE